jgi:hypothetical protein
MFTDPVTPAQASAGNFCLDRGGLPKGTGRTRLVKASRMAAAGCVLATLVMGAVRLPAQMHDVIAGLRGTVAPYANPLQLAR